jgi:hypothetical protein
MKNSSDQSRKVVVLDFTPKEKSDIQTLMRFVEIYCMEQHHREKSQFTIKAFDIKSIRKKDICYALNAQNSSDTALPCASGARMIQGLCARSARRSVIRANIN